MVEAAFFVTASPPDSPRYQQDTVTGAVLERPLVLQRPSPLGGPCQPSSPSARSTHSRRSSRSSARGSCSQPYRSWGQSPKWSFEEAFGDALHQAQAEGVDVFAAAPPLTYRQTATHGTSPKLQAPHTRSSGLVKEESYMARLDGCLTRDFFERPAWNTSTLPRKEPEDLRSHETMARDLRFETMSSQLGRQGDGGNALASTSTGFYPGQGLPEMTPRRKSSLRPLTSDFISRAVAQSGCHSSASGSCRRTSTALSDAMIPSSARSAWPARPGTTTPRGASKSFST